MKQGTLKKKIMNNLFLVLLGGLALGLIFTRSIARILESQEQKPSYVKPASLRTVVETKCKTGLKGEFCNAVMNRIADYCSDTKEYTGDEGQSIDKSWKMHHLLLTIRHGDRTTLNSIPGSVVGNEDIDFLDASVDLLEPEAKHYTHRVTSFRVRDIPSNSDNQPSEFASAINISSLFHIPDEYLSPGMLTSRGYIQHIRLGRHLNRAYSSFLSSIDLPSQIYVRSTNYPRTIQSAVAMITTFLPHVGGPVANGQITINTFKSEDEEIMHGVGLRLSSHHLSVSGVKRSKRMEGDKILTGSCKKAFDMAKAQKDAFSPSVDTLAELEALFGHEVREKTSTELADVILPQICHKKPLPCSESNKDDCITAELAAKIMVDADRLMCDRYFGKSGGSEATKLSTYPLLKEIVTRLNEATLSSHHFKLSVLSGHDTVVMPIVASLLGFEQNKYCIWPGYASRVAFELWSNTLTSKFAVRVVYNGEDITRAIPRCSREVPGFCTLAELSEQVESLLQGQPNLETACAAK